MGKRILVIDDESAVRKSFLLALKGSAYHVDTAANGQEGLAMFRQNHYALVYLDLKMPGLSGVETLLEIRKADNDVPVYIVTAFHREFFEELNDARKQQIDFELLMKPIGLDQIRQVTEDILRGAGGSLEADGDV